MKIKIFYVAERYHLLSVIISMMVCIMLKHNHMLSEKKQLLFYKEIYINTEQSAKKMSGQNLAWKDFRNRMKEKRCGGKRKPYSGFNKLLYFTDTKAFSRKLGNRHM